MRPSPLSPHQDGCGNTLCRQCFMSNVIHSLAARPIQDAQCSACRALIEITNGPISRISRIGTDGRHVESFWPRLGATIANLPLAQLSRHLTSGASPGQLKRLPRRIRRVRLPRTRHHLPLRRSLPRPRHQTRRLPQSARSP